MSTAKVVTILHPSSAVNNIVNDASGNVTVGGTLTASTITSAAATALTIKSAGTTAMTIDTSQNVGIGTNAPSYKLVVSGSSSVITTSIFNSSITSGSSQSVLQMAVNNGGGYINFNTSYVTGGGSYFQLQQSNIGTAFYDVDNQIWRNGSGTERMRIDSSGNVGIGTSAPNASAILDAQSTTKGVRFPNMTTTQKNAVSSPAAGLVVFDTTLAKLCVYSGSAWQTITSV